MEIDGERLIPGKMDGDTEVEHWHRYLLARGLAAGRRVLDIASGEGYGAALLADVAETVVGVDISDEAVDYARSHYDRANLSFLSGSADNIPLADASVDLVVSFETIEHHDKHDEMLRELKRVLTPGGVCIISTPDREIYSEATGYLNPFHVKELSAPEFRDLIGKYFVHQETLMQKYVVGSLCMPVGGGSSAGSYAVQRHEGTPPLQVPLVGKYLVAIASDAPIPSGALSFLEHAYFDQQETEVERLETAVQTLATTVEALKVERDANKAAAADRQRETKAAIKSAKVLKTTVAALQAERDAFALSAQDRENEAVELRRAMDQLASTVDALIAERDAYKSAAEDRQRETDGLKAAVVTLSSTVDSLLVERDANHPEKNARRD